MKIIIALAILIVTIQSQYPIMIYGTNLVRGDLFMTEDQLVERIAL